MILCSLDEVIIFEHGCYILALEHTRMLILAFMFLACINTIYKYAHMDLVRCVKFMGPGALHVYLKFETC